MASKYSSHTVNVVEIADDEIIGIRAFQDNKGGNKAAEALFTKLIKEYNKKETSEDIKIYLEDGVYDAGSGYQIFLIHSS